jgi:hypothetical protein
MMEIRSKLFAARGTGMPVWPGLAWICACLLLLARTGTAATFTASLDRDTMAIGETVSLSLTFNGGNPEDAPAAPNIPNLQIAYVGPSSQFSVINGQVSSSVTYNFTVTARQPGEYLIPAFTVRQGGQKLSTQPLKLIVTKPNAPPPDAINSGTELAFLRLVLPKKELFVGEIVVAELQLYLRSGVQNVSRFQLTGFPADGFTVGKMVEGQKRQTQIGNTAYTVVPITFTMKPIKVGPLVAGPVTANVVVELPSANRRRDVFDPFGMFNRNEQRELSLATESSAVQSLALPTTGVPADFNGAVGQYNLTATAGPTNVTAGDPITLKVQISGRGALDTLTLPDSSAWRDFKTYPPTTKVETSDQLGLQGSKSFEQVVVPQNADLKEIPGVSFSYFDPDRKGYISLKQPPVALLVRPAGASAAPTVVTANRPAQDNPPPTPDIVHIKPRLGAVAQIGPPLLQQPWFLAIQGLPVAALIFTIAWRKRVDSLANNPRLRRERLVAQVVREGMGKLQSFASAKNSDEFFALLFHLLQEKLGERLDLPATAITEAVIEEHLRPRGVAEDALAPIQELFQACNLARYAPVKSSQELAALIPKLEAVVNRLQEVKL